ncbi:MAG: DUF4956 domain-containing protein [Lachnospiraceae bacterium]|nr:DUF4956 domain-containing protein [Lachnospiraceae bacterium]
MLNSIIGSSVTVAAFIMIIAVALALGIMNAVVFSFKERHSASFALTLALLPMAVAVIIMLVNGNVGTGVAVAGAFALVRFRSVPGTAREIAAIFIDMGIGLALGMGYIGIAVIFFAFAAVCTLLLTAVNFGGASRHEKQLKITIPENFEYDGLFDEVFEEYGCKWELEKIRTTNMGTLFELTYHVTFRDSKIPKAFIDELRTRNGNLTITIGDFADKEML